MVSSADASLMRGLGQGEVFLAHNAESVFLVVLEGDGLRVNGPPRARPSRRTTTRRGGPATAVVGQAHVARPAGSVARPAGSVVRAAAGTMAAVQRWRAVADVPPGYGPSVVVIGNFDGVHRGHREVLATVVQQARSRGAAAVAVTFDPHPAQVSDPEHAPPLLTGLEHRLELLAETHLDAVLVLEYTRTTPGWPAEDFVADVLAGALGAVAVVAGRDVRFGTHRDGRPSSLATLVALGERLGFEVVVLEDVAEPGSEHRRWSSSWVRELLIAGDVERAVALLGRPHRVVGIVVHGDHRGRGLGYPTANLGPDEEGLVPADGVYAGWMVRYDVATDDPDRRLPAAVSIGTNPTFETAHRRRVEAYVLDRVDLDLYGERIGLDLVRRLRGTVRFDGVDELCAQMARDVTRCRQLLTAVVGE